MWALTWMLEWDVLLSVGTEYALKDYQDPPPAPLIDPEELGKWSFYRAIIAEFIATLLFLYITVLTALATRARAKLITVVGILGIAWAFGGNGDIRTCLMSHLWLWLAKAFQKAYYVRYGGGANTLNDGYSTGTDLVLRLLALSFLFTLCLLLLILRGTPETLMFLCWHHFQLDLVAYVHWQQSLLLELVLTLLGVLGLQLFMAKTKPGMTKPIASIESPLQGAIENGHGLRKEVKSRHHRPKL
ncbi:hypothetical protein HAX54_039604 [Datura stramonium]|uniref:Uncharacterized protein n=1 Tax=Datura stramonium TaxID=4076 RepID=A0ABS8VLK3_DATST|nr:hypothetical protein [Datura stramonium]